MLQVGRFGASSTRGRLYQPTGALRVRRIPRSIRSPRGVSADGVIPGLESDRQKRVDFVRAIVLVREGEDRPDFEVSDKDRARAGELGLRLGTAATLGDSYLVRSVQNGKQDVLAAFQIVGRDKAALTIAWKILRPAPASR